MIEKQARVQVLIEVYPKQAAIFLYGKILALTAGFFVLFFAFLTLTHLHGHVFRLKTRDKANRFDGLVKPSLMLVCMQKPTCVEFLQMHTVAIHIDDQWVLWDVAIV